jgi:hypothetical protein
MLLTKLHFLAFKKQHKVGSDSFWQKETKYWNKWSNSTQSTYSKWGTIKHEVGHWHSQINLFCLFSLFNEVGIIIFWGNSSDN